MDLVSYIEVGAVGLVVGFLVLMNSLEEDNRSTERILFLRCTVIGMAMIVIDTATWLLNGAQIPYGIQLNLLSEFLYYAGTAIASFAWFHYCLFKLGFIKSLRDTKAVLAAIPMIINGIIAFLSMWTGWYFTIDEANLYSRGAWFLLYVIIGDGYIVAASGVSLYAAAKAETRYERRDHLYLASFVVLPFIAMVLQTIYFGLSIVWVATAIALMVVYLHMQNTRISSDMVTGINNRRSLYRHLSRALKNIPEGMAIFALVIDLDEFKSINDTYGHVVGDEALAQAANILKQSCSHSSDFLARMGGDEFAIIGTRDARSDMAGTVALIQENLDMFNRENSAPYTLVFSMGQGSVAESGMSPATLLARADKEMYNDKHSK